MLRYQFGDEFHFCILISEFHNFYIHLSGGTVYDERNIFTGRTAYITRHELFISQMP